MTASPFLKAPVGHGDPSPNWKLFYSPKKKYWFSGLGHHLDSRVRAKNIRVPKSPSSGIGKLGPGIPGDLAGSDDICTLAKIRVDEWPIRVLCRGFERVT